MSFSLMAKETVLMAAVKSYRFFNFIIFQRQQQITSAGCPKRAGKDLGQQTG